MNLSFSTHWPKTMPQHLAGKPTYFEQKILNSFSVCKLIDKNPILLPQISEIQKGRNFRFDLKNPKLHTIREDKHNRWKAGNDIHFVINNRTKDRFQFAPKVPCVSRQYITIKWYEGKPNRFKFYCYQIGNRYVRIYINDIRFISHESIKKLAINDGFNTPEDFFAWFNTDFESKIIHWTDLKY